MRYVIDTHSLVWYFASDERLSGKVKEIIIQAEQGRNEIIIPVIVLLEAIDIAQKNKVEFNIEELFDFISLKDNFIIIDLTFEHIKQMIEIGKELDLHDRVIYSVAQAFEAEILTKDSEIQKIAKTIW